MADVFSPQARSRVMARVRSRGNASTELRLMALLRQHGLTGWRRGRPLFGSPDFTWAKERVVVFVDGCFWHGCPRHGETPASRLEYWEKKLRRNKTRDRLVTRTLRASGWKVVRVWECLLTRKSQAAPLKRIRRALGR